MTRFRCYILLLLLLWLSVGSGFAQENDPFGQSVVFSHLTMGDGLSSNTVRALLQDERGFVWMGTSRGLNRFDGHRVVAVTGSRSVSVTALVEDGDSIWVGAEDGLYLYRQRTDSIHRFALKMPKSSMQSLNVSSMQMDGQGSLWMATMGLGILCLDTRSGVLRRVPTPDGGSSYGCVYVNRRGEVWASSIWERANLIRYDRKKERFEMYDVNLADVKCEMLDGRSTMNNVPQWSGIALTEDADGQMWIGAWNGGLVCFDPSTHKGRVVVEPMLSPMQHTHSIIEVLRHSLLVGSDRGLTLVDTRTGRTRQHTRDGVGAGTLSDNFVYPLMVDREGGTWVGTYYGGVNYTHPVSGNFTCYTIYAALNDKGRLDASLNDKGKMRNDNRITAPSGNVVNHFCEDSQHRLWIATDDGGLCYYTPSDETFTPVPLAAVGTEHNVHALCMDGDLLYVGTYTQGIDIVDVRTMAVSHVPLFLDEEGHPIDASSYAIFRDRQHRIWVGTFDEVAIFHPDTRTFSDVKKVGVPVLDILQDHADCVWVATDGNGLWRCDRTGAWKHYRMGASLNDKGASLNDKGEMKNDKDASLKDNRITVNSLFEDGSCTLWAGTSEGLFRYDSEKDQFVAEVLSSDGISVYGITAVEGHLWLTTSVGILCYSLTERKVEQVYKGGGNIVSTDFLPDAIYRGYDGRVYIGTTNGFIAFRPQFMHRNEVCPHVVFTGLDIFNRPVEVGSEILPQRLPYLDELRLSYREAVFRITYSAMSYLQPSDILYSCRLEGFDDDWTDMGNQQSVTYTNLSPGTYTLHVRATTNDGMQSPDATLRIVITPPFYWNTPAKILYLLLIVSLVFLYVRRLLRKKEQRHEAEMQELSIQKEQEIQEIHVQKEQEIQELNIQKEQEVHDARIKFMTINEKDQAFLSKMETVIEQNFSNPDLSVDYLASELGVSRSGLFSKIKALADVTPNEMIQVIRLRHAASLLLSGNYRVNEVCYMVGFSSPSYFAKCFQKQYGTTPAKYKG